MSIGSTQQRKHWFITMNFGTTQKHLLEHVEDIETFFLTDPRFTACKGQLEEGDSTNPVSHFHIDLDTSKILRRSTLENIIKKGTGAGCWIDERRGNTNYAVKTKGRLREPFYRGTVHKIKVVDAGHTMMDIVILLMNGTSEANLFNFYPLAYFQWGPKIRDFIKARERLQTEPTEEEE